ncbi:MAG: lamin tail domain-containing protein, partial [Planctomycetota bacterium]
MALICAAFSVQHARAQSADLIISEYVEGSSNNRAIEIYNGTLSTVNLVASNYRLAIYRNGASTPSSTIALSGTLPSTGRWVVASASSGAALLARANQTASNNQFSFNGDDAIVLVKGATSVVVDAFGQVGFDPGTAWTAGGVTTVDVTLVRKPSVCAGDIVANNAFNPSIEWNQFPIDTFTNLGSHVSNCVDLCPNDPNKTAPGLCGCGVPDTDSDADGTPNCFDGCPNDPGKTDPGDCGCGVPDLDSDNDGVLNCVDGCPNDPFKSAPGVCGCGVPDTDSDGDGTKDCNDGCPNDPNKSAPGVCGCG